MSQEAERPLSSEDIIFIFHDALSDRFLLSNRASTNTDLPEECIWPSEKSQRDETPQAALLRGVDEEIGDCLSLNEVRELPIKMAHLLHGYPKNFSVFIISTKETEIVGKEPEKEKFVWVGRDEVMARLSVTESKLIFLLTLAYLGKLKPSDFESAPVIEIPESVSEVKQLGD